MTFIATLMRPSPGLQQLRTSLQRCGGVFGVTTTFQPQLRSLKTDAQITKPVPVKMFTKEESRDFMSVFPDLVRDLTVEGVYKDMPLVNKHLAQCIQYNVPNGKKNRGMAVPVSYKLLAFKTDLTEENIRLANIMGWCVEFFQSFFLMTDDIMENSHMRRGQPTWHSKEEIGLGGINDALLLEACIFTILHTHFKDKPYYSRVLHEFHQAKRHTVMGQALDLLTPKFKTQDGKLDVDIAYDIKVHTSIVKFKTSYYTFCLPGCLAMSMAGINDERFFQQAKSIYLQMGRFHQVQSDYLDCFGDPAVTGRDSTDIQNGRCSWLISVALQRATKEQKEILRDCYGSSDNVKIAQVKQIYEDLNLRKVYTRFEESLYEEIMMQVNQIKGEGQILPPKLFTTFLDRIYKRHL